MLKFNYIHTFTYHTSAEFCSHSAVFAHLCQSKLYKRTRIVLQILALNICILSTSFWMMKPKVIKSLANHYFGLVNSRGCTTEKGN